MKEITVKILTLVLFSCLVVSCKKDSPVVQVPQVANSDMTLSLRFNVTSKVGDPGQDHGEWSVDWSSLGLYIVYTRGDVMSFVFDRSTYTYPLVLNVFEGTADVFVAAFPDGQTAPRCKTREEIYNLTTLDVTTLASGKQEYMRNLFSGVTRGIVIEKEKRNEISVVCNRIVAKVDMQYDVQPGIDNGKFVEAGMSEVAFYGAPKYYMFNDFKTGPSYTEKEIESLSGTLSARNGRVYSYMFPSNGAGMRFTIDYKLDGDAQNEVSYRANFMNGIEENKWYKVNFTVSGKNVDAEGGVDVSIAEN